MRQSGLLSLDIASVVGHAYLYPGDPTPLYGSHRPAPIGADPGEKAYAFRQWLGGKFAELRPRYLIFEAPYIPMGGRKSVINLDTIYLLCGLCLTAEALALEFDVKRYKVQPSQWAKWFLGPKKMKREEKKAACIRACEERGWHVDSDDAADAIGIVLYAEHCLAPTAAQERQRREAGERQWHDLQSEPKIYKSYSRRARPAQERLL